MIACVRRSTVSRSFFFNYTATTEIYTLSLHNALPISSDVPDQGRTPVRRRGRRHPGEGRPDRRDRRDRKSTRLNSSHANISYAVFCLKKNNTWLFQPPSTRSRTCVLQPTDRLS